MKKQRIMSIVFLGGLLLITQILVAQPASDKTAQRLIHINGKGEISDDRGTKLGYISKEDIVFNNRGKKLGFIERGMVYDAEGNRLGKAKKGGHYYNNNGQFVLEVQGNDEKCRILDARGHTIGYVHRNYKLHACAVHCLFKEKKIKENEEAIVAGYLKIKDALVLDDHKAVQQRAQDLLNTSTALNETSIKNTLELLSGSSDPSGQRGHFATLSRQLYTVLKDIDLDNTLYWDHCPMALSGKGASWLSDNEEISNPYMGQKMPACGSLQEMLNE